MATMLEHFHAGGIFMYFILCLGIFAGVIVCDRIYALYVRVKPIPNDFRWKMREFLKRGDFTGAGQYLNTIKGNALSSIISLALDLRKGAASDDELQSRVDEALGEQIEKIDRRTGFLAVFGNVATLMGLLGTISGMITSFAAVSSAESVERAAMLSKGISEAMNCTAFGLLVAIPALVAYAIFQNRTERVVGMVSDNAAKVLNDLIYLNEPVRAQTTV
jgi:biopolymer transport protein ExbB